MADKNPQCLNCGHVFAGHDRFCPDCGQDNHDLKIPFRHMVFEAFETFLHLDSKIFKTLKALMIKPGSLTQLYWSGKRVQYVPPVRLYIMISILFFFTLSVVMHDNQEHDQDIPNIELTFHSVKSSELRGLDSWQIDSVMIARDIPQGSLSRYMMDQLSKIGSGSIKTFIRMMIKRILCETSWNKGDLILNYASQKLNDWRKNDDQRETTEL